MTSPSHESSSTIGAAPGHWQIALGDDADAAWAARLRLAADFWYPAYAFLRAGPFGAEAAARCVEAIIAEFVEEAPAAATRVLRPLLRNHLLEAVGKAYHQQPPERAPVTVLDAAWAEKRFAKEPAKSPAEIFLRAWALIIIEMTLKELRQEYAAAQKSEHFAAFQPFLGYEAGGDEAYELAGRQLGTSSGAVRKAVYEFRNRYREILLRNVAHTVVTEDQIQAELSALLTSV